MRQQMVTPYLVWAVDPLASDLKLQRDAASAVGAFLAKKPRKIQPVFAVRHPLPNLPEPFKDEIFNEVRAKAQEEFDRLVRGLKLPDLLPLKVLEVNHRSLEGEVEAVVAYAKKIRAEAIAVSTRARKGPVRWFLGSFAESLSLKSPIPLFLVNPSWQKKSQIREVLFPTDLSENSHRIFPQVLSFARELGASIRIFHQFGHEVAVTWGFTAAVVYADYEERELKEARITLRQWEKEARAAGVKATSEIETQFTHSIADSILRRSEQNPCVVAMAGESGPIESALLGSVARQVIRGATTPVWVLHSDREGTPAHVDSVSRSKRRYPEHIAKGQLTR